MLHLGFERAEGIIRKQSNILQYLEGTITYATICLGVQLRYRIFSGV